MNGPKDIEIRQVRDGDEGEWLQMRVQLWPDGPREEHAAEIAAFMRTGWQAEAPWLAVAVFVAARSAGGLCGFLEASLRPYAEDCRTWPVGYIEGWFVDPSLRRLGVGRQLLAAAEEWAAALGCLEMASDAQAENVLSRAAHSGLGFEEGSPIVHLRKALGQGGAKAPGLVQGSAPLSLIQVDGTFAICRLDPDAPIPAWALGKTFGALIRTTDELSVVCHQHQVPDGTQCEPGWRCLRVAGSISFTAVGILTRLTAPLAAAGISVFAASTFDTDYLFVKEATFPRAKQVLGRQGHVIR